MINAHVNSLFMIARPFKTNANLPYDFGAASEITEKVRSELPLMLRERLTPPPDESYSLHRKLSGCFLLCTKLQARVPCAELFQKAVEQYN